MELYLVFLDKLLRNMDIPNIIFILEKYFNGR